MPRRRLALVLAALACLAAPARAEDLRYPHLERLFQSRERGGVEIIRAGRPSYDRYRERGPAHRARDAVRIEVRRPMREFRPHAHAPALVAAPAPAAVAPVPKTFFVAVIGDALSMMLADGLAESLARERPQVEVMRRGRDNSGVVREDYFDWRKTARDMAAGSERIDYAVVMMGANDRQPMRRADGVTLDTLSEPWREAYGARVADIVAAFRAKNIPVIWVGLPIMRAERYGADMKTLNALARAAAEKAGAAYVDIWDRFASEAGAYEAEGPDVNGRATRLRTSDGIYFTRAGALKLAHFVEGDIARAAGAPAVVAPQLSAIPPPPLAVSPDAPDAAPPLLAPAEIDVGAMIRRETGPEAGEAAPTLAKAMPELPGVAPPEPLPVPFFPARPAAGAVAPLTQPPRASDGKLASGPPARPTPTEPRPGRGDDFAWPRR